MTGGAISSFEKEQRVKDLSLSVDFLKGKFLLVS